MASPVPWWKRLPVVHQLRQSVGLQRGMLIAGLVITGAFLLTALLAPVLAPYGPAQLRDAEAAGNEPESERLRTALNNLIKERARGKR